MTGAIFITLAALAANFPFFSEKIFFVYTAESGHKAFSWRLAEMLSLYLFVGLIGIWLESRLGPVQTQHWQFYATSFALFIVFAWPGFVWRYFWKRTDKG
ncbi:DUF2818 family protein [Burkholderiaceae bacterium DAT-1]|nr:DUF2818 family protein [Burkholderiaceae bacterium DAT-1]